MKNFECWSDFFLETCLYVKNHYQTPRTGWDVYHTIISSLLGVEEVPLRCLSVRVLGQPCRKDEKKK